MATLTERAKAGQTAFSLPQHNKAATATVNGSAATISSQSDFGVVLASAPAEGALVVITYTPVFTRQVDITVSNANPSNSDGKSDGAIWIVVP